LTRAAPVGGVLALVALLFPVQAAIDRERAAARADPLLYAPNRSLMKAVTFGHGATAGDLLLMRATNHAIREFTGDGDIEYLAELFDAISALDPANVDAYADGALFLSALAGRNPDAVALLDRGIERVPRAHGRRWILHYRKAEILIFARDGNGAGRALIAAGEERGYPEWVELGTKLVTLGLDERQRLATERAFWEEHRASDNEAMRKRAEERLRELEAAASSPAGRPPAPAPGSPGASPRGP